VRFAGVDVGGRRKGFDVAVLETGEPVTLSCPPVRLRTAEAVIAFLREWKPRLVAVDSPISAAPDDARSRDGERALASAVCGIRFTPDRTSLASRTDGYYEWILHGLELYEGLRGAGFEAIECFPTATWTRLGGPRGTTSRARWSDAVLRELPVAHLPTRMGQDARDAIGAAYTARLHARGETETFSELVVPR